MADKGIFPHVFFPKKLPNKSVDGKLIQDEGEILSLMSETLEKLGNEFKGQINGLNEIFYNWNLIQGRLTDGFDVDELHELLQNGQSTALYVRKQNAGLLFSFEESDTILSTFPASLPSKTVTTSQGDLIMTFPATCVKLPTSELFKSKSFAECLNVLNSKEMSRAMPQSKKAGIITDEVRDVSDPMYISKWLTSALSNKEAILSPTSEFPRIQKKLRDCVMYKSSLRPWRRSGLWTTVKIIIQLYCERQFGHNDGKLLYKLIILEYMTTLANHSLIDTNNLDQNTQIIAKLARRILKIYKSNSKIHFISEMHEKIITKTSKEILNISSHLNEYWASINDLEKENSKIQPIMLSKIDTIHKLINIKNYIQSPDDMCKGARVVSTPTRYRHDIESYSLPSWDCPTYNEYFGTYLYDVERWILNNIEIFNRLVSVPQLKKFFDTYLEVSMPFYQNDPVGSSRMILISLYIIQVMDQISVKYYPLYNQHSTSINTIIFEDLLLPERYQMELANNLEIYFTQRNSSAVYPALIEDARISGNSFSVRQARQNYQMINLREQILDFGEEKARQKIEEARKAQEYCAELRRQASTMDCDYSEKFNPTQQRIKKKHRKNCKKCSIKKKEQNQLISFYEKPLPPNEDFQFAVIFELLIPQEIACLRDTFYNFHSKITKSIAINRGVRYGAWRTYNQVKQHSNQTVLEYELVSTAKLFMVSHYSVSVHPDKQTPEELIAWNGYNCHFSHGLKIVNNVFANCTIKRFCIFHVESGSPYNDLQWAIENKNHTENFVISQQSLCDPKLRISEYLEFGTLRAGHRLILRNIYQALKNKKLSLGECSVVSLILQGLWQAGPPTENTWERDTHYDLKNMDFVDEFLEMLEEFMNLQSSNWKETTITLIILCVSRINSTTKSPKSVQLLLKLRQITNNWEFEIENLISQVSSSNYTGQNESVAKLRIKLVEAAIASSCTFCIYENLDQKMNQIDTLSWIDSQVRIKENILLSGQGLYSLSQMYQNFLRLVKLIGIQIENQLHSVLQGNPKCLDEFVCRNWKSGEMSLWNNYDYSKQVYHSVFSEGAKILQIDILNGDFLVNGYPIGRLPELVTNHPTFTRVFGHTCFEVLPDSIGQVSFITKFKYKSCQYSFVIKNNNNFTITEKNLETDQDAELIPNVIFDQDIPQLLKDNYSHWWVKNEQIINFRPKIFQSSNFGSYIEYKLDLSTCILQEVMDKKRSFIDENSPSFLNIKKCLERLEYEKYIHVLYDEVNQNFMAELPKMSLKFNLIQKGEAEYILQSNEYNEMIVSSWQYFGSLVGLSNYLLLEHKSDENKNKILLVPHGDLVFNTCLSDPARSYHICEIDTKSIKRGSNPFFKYEVDHRLGKLKGGQNKLGWLFLAHLHAGTSHPLPDPFTKMTGTEKSLQLLQSAYCWSDKSYTAEEREILIRMAKYSPNYSYYPNYIEVMQSSKYPAHIPSKCASELFHLIVEKLLIESEKLNFLYRNFELIIPEKMPENNQSLLIKNYWKNSKYENGLAKMCPKFDPNFTSSPAALNAQNSFNFSFNTSEITNSRKMAHLCSTKIGTCLGEKFNLLNFLTSPVKLILQGDYNQNFEPSTLFSNSVWDTEFVRNSWINLYCYARSIKIDNLWSQWSLMMSLMAFEGIEIDQLLYLHNIAINSELFLGIDPPSYGSYTTPSANYFNRSKIESILSLNKKSFDYTQIHNSNLTLTSEEMGKKISDFDSMVKHQVSNIALIFENNWPINTLPNVYATETSHLNLSKAIVEINNLLEIWYQNYQLLLFVEKVQLQYNQIPIVDILPGFENIESLKRWTLEKVLIIQTPNFEIPFNDIIKPPSMELEEFSKIYVTGNYKHIVDHKKIGKNSKIVCTSKSQSQRPFPLCIKTRENIESHLMNELEESWDINENFKIFNQDQSFCNMDDNDLNAQVYKLLLTRLWTAIENSLFPNLNIKNQDWGSAFESSGLHLRMSPSKLLPYICSKNSVNFISEEMRDLLGAFAVLSTLEQRVHRISSISKAGDGMKVDLQRELENKGHENWSPKKYPEWLLFELEMDLMIRPVQIQVAEKMLYPDGGQNSLMQLNMGEGKTAVILPLLALYLADGEKLVRIIVLTSLFQINYAALNANIGFLNRRIYTFPFRRDTKTQALHTELMLERYEECRDACGVVLTVPEHCLSFQLKLYEKLRSESLLDARSHMTVYNWLHQNARDILDECDEILNFKYQLVYTVGGKLPLDGGNLRWIAIQEILLIIRNMTPHLVEKFGEDEIEVHPHYKCPKGQFKHLRLLGENQERDDYITTLIAQKILEKQTFLILPELGQKNRILLMKFITMGKIPKNELDLILNSIIPKGSQFRDIFLIFRGILAYGVFTFCLTRRWRVNYGVNPKGPRLMAIPFRAKDIAADKIEFGHIEVAIILTHLCYYYSGLSDVQLDESIALLKKHNDPHQEYNKWIEAIGLENVHSSVRDIDGVNLEDHLQRENYLYPILRENMAVVNFWLSSTVLSKETKQFQYRLACTAWDLCPQGNPYPITGFSGTNDLQLLNPLSIKQRDLQELKGTNGHVLSNILRAENNCYRELKGGATGLEILEMLSRYGIRLLLDVGALMLDLSNVQVAEEWLKLYPAAEACVFFDTGNQLMVLERRSKVIKNFEISSFQTRLNRCLVYLDDIHTRGTDLKFPCGWKGVVTLGKDLNKDRLVQACMRMRLLGQGHSVEFWASKEAHIGINGHLLPREKVIESRHIIQWTICNSAKVIRDGLLQWTAQGVNFILKKNAELNYSTNNVNDARKELKFGEDCCEKQVITLEDLYGFNREEALVPLLAQSQVNRLENLFKLNKDLQNFGQQIVQRCSDLNPNENRYFSMQEGEEERELKVEYETEIQIKRPSRKTPIDPKLDPNVRNFILNGGDLDENWSINISKCFEGCFLDELNEVDAWGSNVGATVDFTKVIVKDHANDLIDEFLRPVRWLVSYKNEKALLISTFEANEYICEYRSNPQISTTLRMFSPKLRSNHNELINIPSLLLGPPTVLLNKTMILTKLIIFTGSLFFTDRGQQEEFCLFLGFVPRGRDGKREGLDKIALDNEWIKNGFLLPEFREIDDYQKFLKNCGFTKNPANFVKRISEIRNGEFPLNSHVAKIVLDSKMTL